MVPNVASVATLRVLAVNPFVTAAESSVAKPVLWIVANNPWPVAVTDDAEIAPALNDASTELPETFRVFSCVDPVTAMLAKDAVPRTEIELLKLAALFTVKLESVVAPAVKSASWVAPVAVIVENRLACATVSESKDARPDEVIVMQLMWSK